MGCIYLGMVIFTLNSNWPEEFTKEELWQNLWYSMTLHLCSYYKILFSSAFLRVTYIGKYTSMGGNCWHRGTFCMRSGKCFYSFLSDLLVWLTIFFIPTLWDFGCLYIRCETKGIVSWSTKGSMAGTSCLFGRSLSNILDLSQTIATTVVIRLCCLQSQLYM